jgi:hypothetical protein
MIDLMLWVIIAGLANYKAAHMISQDGDDGPFDLFKTFRAWVGTTTWIGKGFHCISCTSFWGALIATILINTFYPFMFAQFVLIWGAIATISYIVWRYFA